MEQHPLEKFEPVRKSQLERGLYNRADEGLEAGIGVGDLDLSAGADDAERKHPGCMDQLHGTMDRKAANRFLPGMLFEPALRHGKFWVLSHFAAGVKNRAEPGSF